ncbi:pyridoxal phosphate-dependent aminotransferase [Deinococcus maricopensis]|uniref:histidinol-phosphate transaminase n=1 Tax=Deinococcus maricopensis (strain DSM 21211 / LMG 22137 / NRRL B-23946 / LB-34) TaxID=709986 RepID=E8U9J8_DEIML|nr:histidinol-phosphate transaminase [Deinococcus maricopensis]ADV67737.1 aminotransferase class I and II [Deinococcus maricopensis DSM 21211]
MPELQGPLLPPAPHGGADARAFTGVDFSVNTNPYGPNPHLLQAVRGADHAHYPDPAYTDVRAALAGAHGYAPDEVTPAVGASDLLHRLVRAYLPPGGVALSGGAPFGEFARAVALGRGRVQVAAPDDLPGAVRPGVPLVYVGHPHNPTGHHAHQDHLNALLDACARADALLILDEAYAPFLNLSAPAAHPNLVRLQSPGKAHGLVGARPAYALAAPDVTRALLNLAPAWALPAGTATLLRALHDPPAQAFLTETLPRVAAHARDLARALARLAPVTHAGTPYLTVHVGDAPGVARALLTRGVRARDCTSYGQPHHLRVSTRTPTENALLVTALHDVLSAANPLPKGHG